MSDIEDQFQPIAQDYSDLENDKQRSRYELEVNWSSLENLLPDPPLKIMDYGCGSGTYSLRLAKAGYEVWAVDNAPDMIKQLPSSLVHGQVWDYHSPNMNVIFDIVLAKLVVQFVEDLPKFAKVMSQHLKSGGRLVISIAHPAKSRTLVGNKDKGVYFNQIGESDLRVQMIHRELTEYKQVFEGSGFEFVKSEAPIDPHTPNDPPKRLNMLFEAK